jgi:hypothetical protein
MQRAYTEINIRDLTELLNIKNIKILGGSIVKEGILRMYLLIDNIPETEKPYFIDINDFKK